MATSLRTANSVHGPVLGDTLSWIIRLIHIWIIYTTLLSAVHGAYSANEIQDPSLQPGM